MLSNMVTAVTHYSMDDAINGAKAVKAAALANAKQSLEYAFRQDAKSYLFQGDEFKWIEEPKIVNRNISIHILKD